MTRVFTFLNFDLRFEKDVAHGYYAQVIGAPSGKTAPLPVTLPAAGAWSFVMEVGQPRRSSRGAASAEVHAAREFGGELLDAVFRDEVRSALTTSREQAERRGVGLRLRLWLSECPELANLPWEYLYDRQSSEFMALSEWTPVVRYLEVPESAPPLRVKPPLRILVLVSNPVDFPPLDVGQEWRKLQEALAPLKAAGRVQVDRVQDGSHADLQRQLRLADYHVFHYIGHGNYDSSAGDGALILEDLHRQGTALFGADLGVLLHGQRTLRLAVLNSCEGARGSLSDPYAGTAQSLVHKGIPAVVAMQFEVTDAAAITFTHSLYEAVADGYPLDAAVAEARKALHNQSAAVEWGTPVLYLRAPDGAIFQVDDDRSLMRRVLARRRIIFAVALLAIIGVLGYGASQLLGTGSTAPDPASVHGVCEQRDESQVVLRQGETTFPTYTWEKCPPGAQREALFLLYDKPTEEASERIMRWNRTFTYASGYRQSQWVVGPESWRVPLQEAGWAGPDDEPTVPLGYGSSSPWAGSIAVNTWLLKGNPEQDERNSRLFTWRHTVGQVDLSNRGYRKEFSAFFVPLDAE